MCVWLYDDADYRDVDGGGDDDGSEPTSGFELTPGCLQGNPFRYWAATCSKDGTIQHIYIVKKDINPALAFQLPSI